MPKCFCLRCGYVVDAAAPINKKRSGPPEPGDISLCLNCGGWLKWNDDMHLVLASADEAYADLSVEKKAKLAMAQAVILKRGLLHHGQGTKH